MWLVAVWVFPVAVVVAASRLWRVTSVCQRGACWLLRTLRGSVCVRKTHSYVFSNCTHGRVDSVLETFDLYGRTHPSVAIGPKIGEELDAVVRRLRPSVVLELGTHCGYSSVRMLRLLPPGGRLVTVEQDPVTADLGEEVILVSGFKHHQVLTSSSADAIASLRSLPDLSQGLDLVLMDHDPRRYLADLRALEGEGLLGGCSVLLVNRSGRVQDLSEVLDHVRTRSDCRCKGAELQGLVEIIYWDKGAKPEGGGEGAGTKRRLVT